MKRIKMTVTELTMDDVIRITGEIAESQHELKTDTDLVNQQIDKIKAEHEQKQADLALAIKVRIEQLERWAVANPEAFADTRSIDLPRATVGFRVGNPTVKTTKGVREPEAIEYLMKYGGAEYVRFGKPTLDKESIIRDFEIKADTFNKSGIQIVQLERFYVDVKGDQPIEAIP